MNIELLLDLLRACPIVASVQAEEGTPMDDPAVLLAAARASLARGVLVLRLQGIENIELIRDLTGAPTIGLIKRHYAGSEVYITPTLREVEELVEVGAEIIALDATPRRRPHGLQLEELVQAVHRSGKLALADCDTIASVRYAIGCGADIVSTTLSGYTPDSPHATSPDLRFLYQACTESSVPVLAEGRYQEPWHVRAALRVGAKGVVMGGALNDPLKQTYRFVKAADRYDEPVGAADIGGTWLRFAKFGPDWRPESIERIPLPGDPLERVAWIDEMAARFGVTRVGIASGGVVDPHTGQVREAKPIIPGHQGTWLDLDRLDCVALNDGLAAAWGHACLPEYAGIRVATLALGTGVGCGFVSDHQLWHGPQGQYPRVNDLFVPYGGTIESVLGGANLSDEEDADHEPALEAARAAIEAIRGMFFADAIVVCGGVGSSRWFRESMEPLAGRWNLHWSPFGADATLYGAAALALFPLEPLS